MMKDKIQPYLTKIDECSLRERIILTLGILFVLYTVWQSYLLEPLLKEEKKLISQLSDTRQQLQILSEQLVRRNSQLNQDPNAENRKELGRLRLQLKTIKQEVLDATLQLVSPESMPQILRAVLNRSAGLNLLMLKGLGSSPLVTATNDKKQEDVLISAYKHGMQIVFEADYFQTLDYLHKMEDLEWKFFWDEVSFEMKEYPQASTTIILYTLSLNSDWIGI